MARVPVLALVVASVVASACGGQAIQDEEGVTVVLDTSAAFARAPDFSPRFRSTIDAALRYWGGTWADVSGRTVTLLDEAYVSCGDMQALGCFDGDIRITTRDPGIGTFPCVEATTLVHEVGHAVIGDPRHQDPRWMDMESLAAELSGRTGYTDLGEGPCVTYPSVWRHPPD